MRSIPQTFKPTYARWGDRKWVHIFGWSQSDAISSYNPIGISNSVKDTEFFNEMCIASRHNPTPSSSRHPPKECFSSMIKSNERFVNSIGCRYRAENVTKNRRRITLKWCRTEQKTRKHERPFEVHAALRGRVVYL